MSSDKARRLYFILNGKSGSCNAETVSEAIKRISANYDVTTQIHILREGTDIGAVVRTALDEARAMCCGRRWRRNNQCCCIGPGGHGRAFRGAATGYAEPLR